MISRAWASPGPSGCAALCTEQMPRPSGRSNPLENDRKDARHDPPEPLRSARLAALVIHECRAGTVALAVPPRPFRRGAVHRH
eukprot:scaffold63054_cov60-Phaeocystis_antarctica.AAC.5